MIAGTSPDWEDEISVMRDHLQGITAVLMNPDILSRINKLCPNGHVGETMVRLIQFFYLIENPLAYAEIDLGSFFIGLVDLDHLRTFKLPYKPAYVD